MSQFAQLHPSSGNVFQDVGFPVAEAERELLKADLAFEIHTILKRRKLTPLKAGKILGINRSEVTRLKNGDFVRFSVGLLLTFRNRLSENSKGISKR